MLLFASTNWPSLVLQIPRHRSSEWSHGTSTVLLKLLAMTSDSEEETIQIKTNLQETYADKS